MAERTSYIVSARFRVVGPDGVGASAEHPLPKRLLVGRFHVEYQAIDHARKVRIALSDLSWITDISVKVETVWHLHSGRAVAQLVTDIFDHSSRREASRA